MTKQRRQFSAKFKFQVALEALKELKTINEIASQYEVGCPGIIKAARGRTRGCPRTNEFDPEIGSPLAEILAIE